MLRKQTDTMWNVRKIIQRMQRGQETEQIVRSHSNTSQTDDNNDTFAEWREAQLASNCCVIPCQPTPYPRAGIDSVSMTHSLKFIFGFADFLSDVGFTLILYALGPEAGDLFAAAAFFTAFPVILSMAMLAFYVTVWRHIDRDDMSVWLHKFDVYLILISLLCGGAFTGLELANSNIFHYEFFFMNMKAATEAELKKLRFLVIVLVENIPQLVIQFTYFSRFANVCRRFCRLTRR